MTTAETTAAVYSYHITFEDGSNPYYHFPTTYSRHYSSLRKWKKYYILVETGRRRTGRSGYAAFYRATPRNGM